MLYPGLVHEDHKILGSEYCSGYTDVFGKWNTGFYCPQTGAGATSAVFCCGTPFLKYCCTTKPAYDDEEEDETALASPYTVRIPLYFAVFVGVLAIIILLITAVCFFCSCCFVYKKRRDAASTGLYRIQGSSSTVSALASMYSNQNSNSVVTTPLDSSLSDWSSHVPPSSYIPYPFSQSTLSTSAYPSSCGMIPSSNAHSNLSLSTNNNNNIPAFYYNNNLNSPHPNSCIPNHTNCNSSNSSASSQLSSLSNLYQYQSLNHRPLSSLSTVSTTSTYASNSNRSLPLNQNQQQRVQMLMMQQQQSGYLNGTQIRSQQGYLYRQQQQSQQGIQQGQNYLRRQLAQQLNSFRNPFSYPGNETTTHQNHQGQGRFIQNNNYVSRHPQHHNGNQSSPYGTTTGNNNAFIPTNSTTATATTTPTTISNNTNTIRGNQPRTTQGNHLNHQYEQERLATVQSLISAYHAAANNNSNNVSSIGSGTTTTTPGSRNRQPSLNNVGDVNRLNAINLLVSAVLNQNRRQGNATANANGVIRASGRESGESTTTTTTTSTSNANNSNTTVSTLGHNELDISNTTSPTTTNGVEDNDGNPTKTSSLGDENTTTTTIDATPLTQDDNHECHPDWNEIPASSSSCDHDQKVLEETTETGVNVPLSYFSEKNPTGETRTEEIRDYCDGDDNEKDHCSNKVSVSTGILNPGISSPLHQEESTPTAPDPKISGRPDDGVPDDISEICDPTSHQPNSFPRSIDDESPGV